MHAFVQRSFFTCQSILNFYLVCAYVWRLLFGHIILGGYILGANSKNMTLVRTPDIPNEELPIKMTRDKFQRKCCFFFNKEDNSFNTRIIHKNVFSNWTSTDLDKWVETPFLLFNI